MNENKVYPFNGYAPGNYINDCAICKNTMNAVDKLCFVCLECAIRASQSPIPTTGDVEQQAKETLSHIIQNYIENTGRQVGPGCNHEEYILANEVGNIINDIISELFTTVRSALPLSVVEELEKANPYMTRFNKAQSPIPVWKKCCDKLRELISTQPTVADSKVLVDGLQKIIDTPGDWNDFKQIARKTLGDYKYPGMGAAIKSQSKEATNGRKDGNK